MHARRTHFYIAGWFLQYFELITVHGSTIKPGMIYFSGIDVNFAGLWTTYSIWDGSYATSLLSLNFAKKSYFINLCSHLQTEMKTKCRVLMRPRILPNSYSSI